MKNTKVRNTLSIITLFLSAALVLTSCISMTVENPGVPTANSTVPATTVPTQVQEQATTTPEIFIALTQAMPGQVQLNGVRLAVQAARLDACDLPDCPPAPVGTRYLAVTLQAQELPSDQSLDYKNLPQGIAVHDNTGAMSTLNRQVKYAPELQQMTLYFTVPQNASVFGLQWPGAAEVPLQAVVSEMPTSKPPVSEQPTAKPPVSELPTSKPPVSEVPTALPPVSGDLLTTYKPLTVTIPQSIAISASGLDFPRIDSADAAVWQKTPGHLQVMLADSYVLQGKTHQPTIYVYPALEYAQLVPSAFESIHRLDNILYGPGGASLSADLLPIVPFYNAQQVFSANARLISFQNGQGVRFLTEYAQYPASANNQDLFYNFQGVTRDGAYYIVAVFPITAPALAETSDAGAPLPPGGIAYPYMADPNTNMQAYYAAVSDLLNGTSPDAFTPTLGQLDTLIQSMLVAP